MPWRKPGEGYVGFEFDTGRGKQYGWVRLKVAGDPGYRFILQDYAWADPGEKITASETQTPESSRVPLEDSLGRLAIGGVGLATWRRARSRP